MLPARAPARSPGRAAMVGSSRARVVVTDRRSSLEEGNGLAADAKATPPEGRTGEMPHACVVP